MRSTHSSALDTAQIINNYSMITSIGSLLETIMTPALWLFVMNAANSAGIVLRSWLTSTRCCCAAIANTSESLTPSSPATKADWKSTADSRRKTPVRMIQISISLVTNIHDFTCCLAVFAAINLLYKAGSVDCSG